MRLDKLLSACGYGTRTEVKKLIRQGVVTVGGETARDSAMQVKPGELAVEVNGVAAEYREHVYVMLHKPSGVVSATGDRWHDTVLDLLEGEYAERSLFPVGRLDRDTTGLLLLTDDGPLAHDLLSPKKHVEKVYEAELDAPAEPSDVEAFARGIDLGDFVSKPARLELPGGNRALVSISEGKFHEVRRLFEARGKAVLSLHRVSMGPLRLDGSLAPGQWRDLTQDEVSALKNRENGSGA